MEARITTLAQLMRLKKENGSTFVLMFGAGASLSSGIKKTDVMMTELLAKYAPDLGGDGDLMDRFDELWGRSTEDRRRQFLAPYLDRPPAAGYLKLAELIQAGYFDLAITFNYDDLLRKALVQIGFDDYHVVIRGETELGKIDGLVESPPKKFTLLKLHGSVFSTNTFLFDRREMNSYPPEIDALFNRLTSRDIVVCGYGFADNCVIRSFSDKGGSVFWVNPSGAPSNAKGFLLNRNSKDFVVSGEFGYFDPFFAELRREILEPPPPPPSDRPRANPFRFLESFDVADKDWFFGREEVTLEIVEKLSQHPGALYLYGPSKEGKTSLVRAGVLAALAAETHEWIYLRCQSEIEKQLRGMLAERLHRDPAAIDLGAAFEELARSLSKHLVVVLDQFERVLKVLAASEDGAEQLGALVRLLRGNAAERVTFILVAPTDGDYITLMWTQGILLPFVQVKKLKPEEALAVVGRQAGQAGLAFDPEILQALRAKLGESYFTLAHLQTICYLLAEKSGAGRKSYASLIGSDLESSLDSAIRDSDVMNFVEDFPAAHERKLVRSFLKIVSEPSRRTIAAHIRDRFADLLKDPQYPEPF